MSIKDPCKEKSEKQLELKSLTKEFRDKVKECEDSLYGSFKEKYFKTKDGIPLTHDDLLKGLFNYYKDEKTKDINFMLTFQQFIDKFPRDQAVSNTNYKKQHIFEALCRLLLLFDYDKGELGYKKEMLDSLEHLLDNKRNQLNRDAILALKVNEASKGGIVDILFQTNVSEETKNEQKLSACEIIYDKKDNSKQDIPDLPKEKKPTTIMIQNKYFDKEKTNIDKYDVTRMHALAVKQGVKTLENYKIILMVNNEEALSANLLKSKQQFNGIIHKIYGVVQIDKWFQDMLYDLFKNATIADYLLHVDTKQGITNKDKPLMTTRFHQLLITKSTVRYYNEQGIKKFIWGAVPRSGKSFMVADLVDKRKEVGNDVVIILGAKTETEQQFIEMFRDFSNFNDYSIITPNPKINIIKQTNKTIYILSQEWFKSGKIKLVKNKKTGEEYYTFNTEKIKFLEPLIKKDKKIDIFFDEIHKGGSTDNSVSILNSFIRSKMIIDIFVMVTATFAKPTMKYDQFMEGKTELIEWSYNDQQNMKQVINKTKKQMMINSRNKEKDNSESDKKVNIEKEVIEELFNDYQTRYGEQYLSVLSSEYEKYPELVLITPQILNSDKEFNNQTNDVRNIFTDNLKCDACISGKNIEHYIKPENIFKQEAPVTNLLDYIGEQIYNSFQTKFNYPISSSHTELWFLPDKNLYHDDCSEQCKKIDESHQVEEDMQGGALGDEDEEGEDKESEDIQDVEDVEVVEVEDDEVEHDEAEDDEVEHDEAEDDEAEDDEAEDDEAEDDKVEDVQEMKKNITKKNNSIPNIEPLTRGLAIKIVKNQHFSNYNVFIVHNTDLKYLMNKKVSNHTINKKTLFDSFNKIKIKLKISDLSEGNVYTIHKLGKTLLDTWKKIGAKNPKVGEIFKCNKNINSIGKYQVEEGEVTYTFDTIEIYDNKKGSLKDQIKNFEKETYKVGRSLIVLTGAKLRLGISLTCADIAFNFDNIKSVDNNYQTMFRVLTERENPQMKKYGYYLDFNKDRSIEFLYQYSAVYGEKNGKKTLKESVEYLQTLLFSFNYNGLNLVTHNTKQELDMYNDLIKGLTLSPEEYVEYWTKNKNLVSLIQKGLNQSINKEELKKLGAALEIKTIKKPKKINISLKKGENRKKMKKESNKYEEDDTKSDDYKEGYKEGHIEGSAAGYLEGEESDSHINPETSEKKDTEWDQGYEDGYHTGYADGYNTKYDEEHYEGEDEEEDPMVMDKIIEFLSNSIPSIISLLSLFSQENELNCSSIEECLENSITQIESFTELCKCSNIEGSNIIDCFLNSPKNINGDYVTDKENHKTLKENLITVLAIIQKEIQMNEILRRALELKFNIILKEMKEQKGALIIGMKSDEIKKLIEDNLTIKKEEKDKFGEVFTPPALINEMLDKLPAEVWSNPELKWLDPANGIGNFPMIVYERLMKGFINKDTGKKIEGLEKSFSDEGVRSSHILTKMLFMTEINPKNVKISKKIFGDNANIVCGDFLSGSWKKDEKFEGIDMFDVIIGNPPFQIETGERRFGTGRTLWDKFIEKSLELLYVNGYLGFITPPPWRGLGNLHKLWNIMTKNNQLLYLHIFGEKQGKQLFNVSQRVDLYIIKKTPVYTKTDIIDELENKLTGDKALDLQEWDFLPNYAFVNIKKIITTEEKGIKVIYDTFYHTQNKKKGLLSLTYSENKYKYCVANNINIEIECLYTNDNTKGHFGIPKVIISVGRYPYPHNDYKGVYGMSQGGFGIPIANKKEGDDIVNAINTEEFKEIIKATKWGAFQIDYRMFKYFKPDFYKNFLTDIPSAVYQSSETSDTPTQPTQGGSKKKNQKPNKKPNKKTNKKTILKKVNTLKRYKKLKNKSLKKFKK